MRWRGLYLVVALATAVAVLGGGGPVGAQGSGPPAASPPGSGPPGLQALPAVASDDPWFGAVQAIAAPQAAQNAGVKWQRLIFAWNAIQPDGPGDFKAPEYSDADVNGQLAQGVPIVGITLYTPRWAARDAQYEGRSVPRNLE